MTAAGPGRLLLIGGAGGLVGRAVLREFGPTTPIRSVHRHPSPEEVAARVEWVPSSVENIVDWRPLLRDVDWVVNLAWYRHGGDGRFRALAAGLERAIAAASELGVRRFVQVSVPDAPPNLEVGLPYLVRKREVDRALASSALDYVILRPTMLFGPRDKLLSVMMRTIARYHRFPMFGDGEYHLSPLSAADLARIVRAEGSRGGRRTVTVGGPERFRYRDLTDRLFAVLGRTPRYVRFSPRGAVRLARLLEAVGSTLLYAYEVEWLLSDRLGPPAYEALGPTLATVGPFLESEAARYGASRRVERG